MIIAAILLAASEPPVGRDIRAFCRNAAPCVARQKEQARFFLGHMVLWKVPNAVAERCMRVGRRGRYVDWTVATPCLRKWAKGRPNLIEEGVRR